MIFRRLRALLFKPSEKAAPHSKAHAIVSALEAVQDPYPYAYVNEDGTARELHPAERNYLEQAFVPFDGGRPYVKSTFEARDGWGSVKGFIQRSKLPDRLLVGPPPQSDPSPPMSKAEHLAFAKEKAVQFGFDVIEKPDGSFEMKRCSKR
jgi:hypothetical protein